MEVYSSYLESALGLLKITCTDSHLTSLLFMDKQENDSDNTSNRLVEICKMQLEEYFSGERRLFDLPLGQKGTAFQDTVWQLLVQIPYGRTISYNELAKQYGDIKAIRAVAAANGKNNIAIIVPCHRVIGSNQKLVGYAGGLWRKKWLLNHEATVSGGLQQLPFPIING